MSRVAVSAPGKAFLCGEYAVTEGAPAIVAAVDRRVVAGFGGTKGDGYPLGPEAAATLELARQTFGPAPAPVALDRRELFEGETKLGLGSSAAGAVAVAGAVAAHHGHDLEAPAVRRRILSVALSGHEQVAPDGSGADVATATHGGFIRFERSRGRRIEVERESPPPSLVLSLIWTGTAVRTSDLLRSVKHLRASNPKGYDGIMATLREAAEHFALAFHHGEVPCITAAVRLYHETMAALGRAANAPIVDSSLAAIAEAATREGGAAKPCGAGGGDVAVAFFSDKNAARRFEVRCAANGLKPLPVTWGASGIHNSARLWARKTPAAVGFANR